MKNKKKIRTKLIKYTNQQLINQKQNKIKFLPIPNPQSPIPNPQINLYFFK